MILSLKKSIFLLLFVLFQVLFAIYNKSSLEIILISFYLLFLFAFFSIFKLRVQLNLKIFWLWVVFLILLTVSSFFSISKPLSLDILIFYIASFCTFVFFRSLESTNQVSRTDIVSSLLGSGLIMSFLFIIVFVTKDLFLFNLPMNLVSYIYGHSHLASVLLLLIPLSWWYVQSEKVSFSRKKILLLIFFYVILVLTFGRFAIFLSLIQVPFIFKTFNRKHKQGKLLVFVGFFLFFLLLSLTYLSKNESKDCYIGELENQICKPIKGDMRYMYFSKALSSFNSKPIFGHGPGTYQILGLNSAIKSEIHSSFAHNTILQLFAESGSLSGVVFIVLIVTILKKIYASKNTNYKDNNLNDYIFIGVLSIFFNSQIDFDWNLFLVFQMSLILMSISFWGKTKVSRQSTRNISYFWIVLVVLVVVIGTINLINSLLIRNKQDKLAFDIFPYFFSQSEYFLNSKDLNESQMDNLYKIYSSHPNAIRKRLENESDIILKGQLFEKLLSIESKSYISSTYYDFLVEIENYNRLGEVAYDGLMYMDLVERHGSFYNFNQKLKLAEYLRIAANHHLQNGDIDTASKYYSVVLNVQNWVFLINDAEYLNYSRINTYNFGEFLSKLDLKYPVFGSKGDTLFDWYINHFKVDIFSSGLENSNAWINFFSGRENELWMSVSDQLFSEYRNEVDIVRKKYVLLIWYSFWKNSITSKNVDSDIDRGYQFKLMNRLFLHDQNEEAEVIQKYLYNQILP